MTVQRVEVKDGEQLMVVGNGSTLILGWSGGRWFVTPPLDYRLTIAGTATWTFAPVHPEGEVEAD